MAEQTGSAHGGESSGRDESNKRRLSSRIRSTSSSPDKKARIASSSGEMVDKSKGGEPIASMPRNEREREARDSWHTAKDSNNDFARLENGYRPRSYSNHSSDSDDQMSGGRTRTESRKQQTNTSSRSSTSTRDRTMISDQRTLPKWRTASVDLDNPPPGRSTASARSSINTGFPHNPGAISRMPSPPSFNLSSGRPLVNPPLKTQAAFVGKLYAMLEDADIKKTGLIYWSPDGSIFTCPNPTEFSKIVLPRFFKHNNWQSFVRQLNMYSFSKVNDLLATTTDPGAWEFRHPLFRRGEPQLLASIKRKTTRNATQEGSVPLASPIEEYDQAKAMAGWMRDAHHGGSNRGNSPPRDREALMSTSARRAPGYEKLSLSGSSQAGSPPASGHYGAPPNLVRIPLSMDTSPQPRHQPNPSHPAATAHFSQAGFSGSPYYPQPQQSPVDMLSGQVAALEDRVQRLTDTLSTERVDNVRSHLDLTSYLLQLSGWIGESMAPPHSDLRALQDTLNRTSADMRHKYEALMASNALAIMATSDRDDWRGYVQNMNIQPNHAYTPRSLLPTLPELRPPSSHLSRRASPLDTRYPADQDRHIASLPGNRLHSETYPPPTASRFRPYSRDGDREYSDQRPPILLSLPPLQPGRLSESKPVVELNEDYSMDASAEDRKPAARGLSRLLN